MAAQGIELDMSIYILSLLKRLNQLKEALIDNFFKSRTANQLKESLINKMMLLFLSQCNSSLQQTLGWID